MATKTKAKGKVVAKKAAPGKTAKKSPPKKSNVKTAKSSKAAKPAKKASKPVKTTAVKSKPAAKAKRVKKTASAAKGGNKSKATAGSKKIRENEPATRTSFGAKPIGTKARNFSAGRPKGSINGSKKTLPEKAADIPTRQVKMQQPKVRISKQDPNKTRYSDSELQEFRQLIEEKLEAARTELRYLQDQINRKDDNGTDDTENKFANLEDGSITMEREYLNQMAVRQAQYIDHLEKALIRIQNKTYGICRVTGKLIDKERLRAVPHATLSMEAKLMQNR